ncbi:MAG: hypothetical protein IIB83_08005, partial [Bacteroidetes bacterium]|nr:hypothetical protein [Bacteroidota bacterium]
KPPVGGGIQWRKTGKLYSGCRVGYIGEPWEEDNTKDAGYLASVYDGEGNFHAPLAERAAFRINFSQNEGVVLDKVRVTLCDRKFNIGKNRNNKDSNTKNFYINGLYQSLRFLGEIRPQRLLKRQKDLWCGKSPNHSVDWIKIDSIEAIGKKELIDIETETKTFFAEGFISHNSAAADRKQASIVFDVLSETSIANARVLPPMLSGPIDFQVPISKNLLVLFKEFFLRRFAFGKVFANCNSFLLMFLGISLVAGSRKSLNSQSNLS